MKKSLQLNTVISLHWVVMDVVIYYNPDMTFVGKAFISLGKKASFTLLDFQLKTCKTVL